MKLLFVNFCILFSVIGFGQSQNIKLSNNAEVSILTINQGKNLYDSFGHNAIRIKDINNKIDLVYNYGTYDFNTPNFYTKFAQGKLLYDLKREPFYLVLQNYKNEDRGITEQILTLSRKEKQRFLDYLENNLKPRNRKYLYDFFYDNCATRVKKVTNDVLGEINIDYKEKLLHRKYTLRDLIHRNLDYQPWGKFGIDLALGAVIDRKARPKEYSFLPEYIQKNFANARLEKLKVPLVKQTKILFKESKTKKDKSIYSPLLISSILCLFVMFITYKDFKAKTVSKKLDLFILFFTGLVGVIVFLLWFATDHSATKDNFNILWAFFPNIIIIFVIYRNEIFTRNYYIMLLSLILAMILLWVLRLQIFNIAMIPIIILLSLRYIYNIWYLESLVLDKDKRLF